MAPRMTKAKPTTLPNAVGTLIAALMFVLGAALLAGLIAIDAPLPPLESAVSTDATIVGNRIQPGEWSRGKFPTKSADRYYVQISFVASDTQVHANEVEVGQAYFNSHLPGKQVTAWYFPERPQVSVLNDPHELADKGSRFGQLFGWLFLGIGAAGAVIYGNKLHVARGGQSLL